MPEPLPTSAVRDWSSSHAVTDDYMGTLEFIPGRMDGEDPSFAALGRTHGGAQVSSGGAAPQQGG